VASEQAAEVRLRASLNLNKLGHDRCHVLSHLQLRTLLAILSLPEVMPARQAALLFADMAEGQVTGGAGVAQRLRPFAQHRTRQLEGCANGGRQERGKDEEEASSALILAAATAFLGKGGEAERVEEGCSLGQMEAVVPMQLEGAVSGSKAILAKSKRAFHTSSIGLRSCGWSECPFALEPNSPSPTQQMPRA
jgi:hypothetical protein